MAPLKASAAATGSVLRAALVSRARAPTSYQLFCAAERKAGKLPKGLGDQAKALSAKWNALGETARNPYEVQAKTAKATEPTGARLWHTTTLAQRRSDLLTTPCGLPAAPLACAASGFTTGSISIKSESALEKASKKLSEAAVQVRPRAAAPVVASACTFAEPAC